MPSRTIYQKNNINLRLWRSWITQQIPILKNGGSNPLRRAKKTKSEHLHFFIHCESNGISSTIALLSLHLISP